MQIVINIDEARFKDIQRIAEVQIESNHFQTAEQIIANGTPLPKGHEKLKDTRVNMSNAEKFEEVFGFKPNKNLCYAPEDVECPSDCDDCQYISWLNDEYTAEPKQGK